MKKKILRVVAGATLMVAMVVGVQMHNGHKESSLMMENLQAIAMADGESGGSKDCYSSIQYIGGTQYVRECDNCNIRWQGYGKTYTGTKGKC